MAKLDADPGMAHDADPDRAHTRLFTDLAFDPVFITGDHRSGTTVLYSLLAATGAFTVVTAYHVIRYRRIVDDYVQGRTGAEQQALSEHFARLGLDNRVLDGVRVSPDLPEEYGFVIDRSPRPRLTPQTLPSFIELCRKMRLVGGDRPLLLKNPWDVLEFAFIKQAFPRARFIFLHRHPIDVMNSQLRAMRSLFERRNDYVAQISPWYRDLFTNPAALFVTRAVQTPRFGLGARLVGRHVVKVANYFETHIGGMPARDFIELRYEDLCSRPDAELGRLLAFCEVRPAHAVAGRAMIQPRPRNLLPEVRARYGRIAPALERYRARHGYDRDGAAS